VNTSRCRSAGASSRSWVRAGSHGGATFGLGYGGQGIGEGEEGIGLLSAGSRLIDFARIDLPLELLFQQRDDLTDVLVPRMGLAVQNAGQGGLRHAGIAGESPLWPVKPVLLKLCQVIRQVIDFGAGVRSVGHSYLLR